VQGSIAKETSSLLTIYGAYESVSFHKSDRQREGGEERETERERESERGGKWAGEEGGGRGGGGGGRVTHSKAETQLKTLHMPGREKKRGVGVIM